LKPIGPEASRFLHYLGNRLADSSKVVNLIRRRTAITITRISGTHFCQMHLLLQFNNTVCPQSSLGVLKNCVLCSTLCIVECGGNNSREARHVDFVGLRINDARFVSAVSLARPFISYSYLHPTYPPPSTQLSEPSLTIQSYYQLTLTHEEQHPIFNNTSTLCKTGLRSGESK
jgi:hypothetical protein